MSHLWVGQYAGTTAGGTLPGRLITKNLIAYGASLQLSSATKLIGVWSNAQCQWGLGASEVTNAATDFPLSADTEVHRAVDGGEFIKARAFATT